MLLVPRPSHTHPYMQYKNYSALLLVSSMPLLFSLSGPPYRLIAIAGPCHAINLRHRATVINFFRLDASSPAAVSFYTDGTEHYMRRYISRPSSLVSGFKTSFETIVANKLFPSHQTLWSYGWGRVLEN